MRRLVVWIAVFGLFAAVGCAKKEKAAIVIGPTTMTAEEFDAAYNKAWSASPVVLDRKDFLEKLIDRKLILQEAETLGLDKDPQFLDNLQLFWEQSLMKLVIARKLNELALVCRVSDKEIEDYYQRHKEDDFAGKEFSAVKDQIRSLLFRLKRQLELQRWTKWLRERANIKVDYDLLKIPGNK